MKYWEIKITRFDRLTGEESEYQILINKFWTAIYSSLALLFIITLIIR
jgi:hypothetical protein